MTALACVLAAAAYASLWYLIGEKLERAAAQNVLQAQSLARGLELSTLEKTLADTRADRTRLKDFVVTDDKLTEFLALVEGAVRSQGLKASTRAVEIEPGDGGPFETLKLTVAAEGDYEALKRLIVLLETMPYQIDMRSVRMDRSSADVWAGVFTFAVTKARTP
jgi:hypothetical protein